MGEQRPAASDEAPWELRAHALAQAGGEYDHVAASRGFWLILFFPEEDD